MKQRSSKQKRRKAKRKNNKTARPPPPTIRPSWVDQVAFVPVNNESSSSSSSSSPETEHHNYVTSTTTTATASNAPLSSSSSSSSPRTTIQVSIVSWNVLAQTYCTRRSHPHLPQASSKVVFNPIKRKKRILEVLDQMATKNVNHRNLYPSSFTSNTDATEQEENHHEDDDDSDDSDDKEEQGEEEEEAERACNGNDNTDNGDGCVDIFCLQEVDMPEIGRHLRDDLHYHGIETPRISGGGSGGRADSCVVYANSKRWQVLEHEIIRLDDLATLSSSSSTTSSSSTSTSTSTSSSTNFQGLQTSFLRRNAAMLVRLQYIPPPTAAGAVAAATAAATTIVVANAHLYWHPGYEYVKLCQTHYILQRARSFLRKSNEPLILCGDLNSKPNGCCHSYLTRGCINAKIVAPWYNNNHNSGDTDEDEDEALNDDNDNVDGVKDNNDFNLVEEEMNALSIRDQAGCNGDTDDDTNKEPPPPHDLSIASCASATTTPAAVAEATAPIKPMTMTTGQQQQQEKEAPEIRYLLDVTLNRLCRWLRILGIDTALETEQEEQQRTRIVITKGSRQSSKVNETAAATTATSTLASATETADVKNGGQEAVAESTGTSKETTDTTTANGNTQFNLYSSRRVLLFDRCHKERRTLVTTSIRLAHRNDCPPGTYCIHPTSLGNLEVVMVHMLKTHGVVLDPVNKFLSRCVVCNGNILSVGNDLDEKRRILESYDAPLEKLMDANVYECDGCKQGYWWSEDVETYSASRVKDTAKRLFLTCLAGGIPMVQDKDNTACTTNDDGDGTTTVREYDLGILNDMGINVDAIRRQGWDFSKPGSELLRQELDVIEWLKKEELTCPFQLESAYSRGKSSTASSMGVIDSNASDDDTTGFGVFGVQNGDSDHGGAHGELLPFTNVTAHFVNTLDYIFFERQKFVLRSRLFVPTTFREMNAEAIHNGHLLPSDVWPSDHVAIGARLLLVPEEEPEQQGEAVPNKSDSMTVRNDDTWMFCAPTAASGQFNGTSANTNAPATPLPPPPPLSVNHGQRCDCGCVPPIPSLFEMAELRKQYRQRKELEKKQQQQQQQQQLNHP